jgi:8-oxo-dGTP pyrophosphatase MutT (NUDIX family)
LCVIERFQVVPAAYVLPLRETGDGTEVLLSFRRGTGYMDEHWAFAAAGHVEAGESVLAAAVREVAEELGITVDEGDLRPVSVMHRTSGDAPVDQRVDFFFTIRRWSGDPTRKEPDKSAALGWFPLGALPAPVVPHERQVLDGLAAGAVPAVTVAGF